MEKRILAIEQKTAALHDAQSLTNMEVHRRVAGHTGKYETILEINNLEEAEMVCTFG